MTRYGDVGVQHISGPYDNIVQHCYQWGDTHSLLGYDPGIHEGCWSLCCMSPDYKPCVTPKILHLDIKDHVTTNVLMIRWPDNAIPKDIKCNMRISHLLLDCIMPKGSTCGFVNGVSILNRFREFNPKLMCMLMVLSTLALNQGDNPVSLLEDLTHPPVESWFISNMHDKRELSHLERV